ncbi:MAG: hypothetical protein M0R40_07035 [Firmicutes bacterium]|nr:hypothetical protein [Bacillota bacterium]
MQYCNPMEQKQRTDKINKTIIEYYKEFITQEGAAEEWQKNSSLRDALFLIHAFLSIQPQKHMPLIEKLLTNAKKTDYERICTFTPFMSLVTLMQYESVLPPTVKGLLEQRIFSRMKWNEQESNDFIGVNDNTPAMIMALLILAGERYNNQKWLEIGLCRLQQLEDMQKDRTFISEFNSPTYHAITIYAMAALGTYTKNEGIKKRAIACEIALWETTFILYHRDTFHIAGPYSRAYKVDSLAHTHQYRMVLYQVMGEQLKVNPLNTIFRSKNGFPGMCTHGASDPPWFMQFSNCWLSNMEYHCPQKFIDDALERKYPFFFHGDAQVSSSADAHLLEEFADEQKSEEADLSALFKQEDIYEYSAGETDIFSYITDLYVMGTCTKEFHNGEQTDSFHIIASKKSPAKAQEDISSIYTRCIINNGMGRRSLLPDAGRKLAFQYKNTAMVLYSPKTMIQQVSSIKLAIIIDNRFNNVSEIVYNGKKLDLGDEIIASQPIFARLTDVYCAFYPLTGGEAAKVRLEKLDTAFSLSIIGYEGDEVHFTRKRLKLLSLGFVCEIRNKNEAGSFDGFIKSMQNAQIQDRLYANPHTRYTFERKVNYLGCDASLECSYSPVSEGIRYIRANGKLLKKYFSK